MASETELTKWTSFMSRWSPLSPKGDRLTEFEQLQDRINSIFMRDG